MFTGLVTAQGRITRITRGDDWHMTIAAAGDVPRAMGDSISVNGICLTVTAFDADSFSVTLSSETVNVTTANGWREGDTVNLEPALALGDRLGGHIVSGHVDGIAQLLSVTPSGESAVWEFRAPATLAKYIAAKGSVTLDGVSLTVNRVEGDRFFVMVIPHTASVTTFGAKKAGDSVNLEVDMLARYVERLLQGAA